MDNSEPIETIVVDSDTEEDNTMELESEVELVPKSNAT